MKWIWKGNIRGNARQNQTSTKKTQKGLQRNTWNKKIGHKGKKKWLICKILNGWKKIKKLGGRQGSWWNRRKMMKIWLEFSKNTQLEKVGTYDCILQSITVSQETNRKRSKAHVSASTMDCRTRRSHCVDRILFILFQCQYIFHVEPIQFFRKSKNYFFRLRSRLCKLFLLAKTSAKKQQHHICWSVWCDLIELWIVQTLMEWQFLQLGISLSGQDRFIWGTIVDTFVIVYVQ